MDEAESYNTESNPGTPLPIDAGNGVACVLCQRTLFSDEETFCVCGDCKFLLLEDFSSPSRHAFGGGRRRRRRRRRISTVAPSIIASEPSVIGGQFIASAVATASDDDNRSRRWRVVLSDSENSDSSVSIYVGSESTNASFRIFHGESSSDANSVGGESEDDHSFLETGMLFLPSLALSDFDSDVDDIDPMHAGPINWDWGEDEEELEPWVRVRSNRSRRRGGFEELLVQQETDSWGTPTPAAWSFVNSLPRIVIRKGEENDRSSSKREKESSDHQEASASSMCAICKDLFLVGSEAIQLPCVHLYHPSCIFPWLSARNSCPLCRYELPTNDSEYEEWKNAGGVLQHYRSDRNEGWDSSGRVAVEVQEEEIVGQVVVERDDDSGSEDEMGGSHGEHTDRNVWWISRLTAAAPIVGLVGVVFVILMGKPVTAATTELNLRNQGRGSRWPWRWSWF